MLFDLIIIFVFIYLQIIIHEVSHVIPILVFNQKVVWFRPWPHKTSQGWIVGGVYWNQVSDLTSKQYAIINLFPMFVGTIIFFFLIFYFHFVKFDKFLWIVAQIAITDVVSNLFMIFSKNKEFYDYCKGMDALGITRKKQVIIAIFLIVCFFLILFGEFHKNVL